MRRRRTRRGTDLPARVIYVTRSVLREDVRNQPASSTPRLDRPTVHPAARPRRREPVMVGVATRAAARLPPARGRSSRTWTDRGSTPRVSPRSPCAAARWRGSCRARRVSRARSGRSMPAAAWMSTTSPEPADSTITERSSRSISSGTGRRRSTRRGWAASLRVADASAVGRQTAQVLTLALSWYRICGDSASWHSGRGTANDLRPHARRRPTGLR